MKKHKEANWPEIFFDYYSGKTQRELVKKYDVPDRTIRDRCKEIFSTIMRNEHSIIRRNWLVVECEIREIIREEDNSEGIFDALNLSPEIRQTLKAKAISEGISIKDFLNTKISEYIN